MNITPVSFGRVIAVSGKPRSVIKLDHDLRYDKNVINCDLTDYYFMSRDPGLLAVAAQKGRYIRLIITGEEKLKYEKKEQGWTKFDDILSHMESYVDLTKTSVKDLKKMIRNK